MVLSNTKMFKLIVVCLTVLPLLALAAPVQDFTPAATSTVAMQEPSVLSNLSLDISMEYSQEVAKAEQASRVEAMDLMTKLGYKLNEDLKFSLRSIISQASGGANETQISDTALGLSIRGKELNSNVVTFHSISGVFPTSEKSRDQDRLKMTVSLLNGVQYSNQLFTVRYRLGLAQNFHEFNLNASGSANIENIVSHSVETQYKVTEKFYLSAVGTYVWARTYGQKERSLFEILGDLNYDITSKMTLNLGTSNGGSAVKANGVKSNISAFNENSAVLRAGVSISL